MEMKGTNSIFSLSHNQGMNHRPIQQPYPPFVPPMQYNQYNNGQYFPPQFNPQFMPHPAATFQPSIQPPSIEPQLVQQNLARRERKPLPIVDPKTSTTINETLVEKSNNVTPNTIIGVDDNDEVKKLAFRKEFTQKIGVMQGDKKKSVAPVAQSEPKEEVAAVIEKPEINIENTDRSPAKEAEPIPIQPQVIAEPQPEPVEPEKTVKETILSAIKIEPIEKIIDSLEKATIEDLENVETKPQEEDVSSLEVLPVDNETSGPSVSVEVCVPECEEEEAASPSPDPEDERRLREEEEAENLRLKKIELDTKLAEYEIEPSECNTETGSYNRNFMYCVRDLEKFFNITKPPVPLEVLKETYNIDIHSMPAPLDGKQKKRQTDFNPLWVQKYSSTHGGSKYPSDPDGNRGPRIGGGNGKKYTPRPFIERSPRIQLGNKAENAWKAEKIRTEDLDKEENKVKVLLKAVRSLLNKITPTTKDELTNEFLSLQVTGEPPHFKAQPEQLSQVIQIIFDKAVEEPRFCSIYSEICRLQVDTELRYNRKFSPFRNAILTQSQNVFKLKNLEIDQSAIENETDDDKKKEMSIKAEEDFNKFRRRKFGNITFIGQLYYQQLLSTKIIQWCLFDLLQHTHPDSQGNVPKPPYDEESLLCAIQLLEVVGQTFEGCKDFAGAKEYVSQIFSHLKSLASQCTPKIKFKIIGVAELREAQWQQRKVVDQGPKKITEIHQEIQQEQQQKQQERDAYGRKLGGGVRTGSSSLDNRRNNAPPARNSFDFRVNSTQNKRAVAGMASKLVSTSAQQPRNMSISLSSSSGSKKNWQKGAAGGGTSGEGPGFRAIIQRNSGSQEGSESRKSSMAIEREASLQAARDISAGKLSLRNASQIPFKQIFGQKAMLKMSVASQEDRERADEETEEKQSKIARRVSTLFKELTDGDIKENELVEDLLKVQGQESYGSPDLSDIFQRYIQTYIQEQFAKKEEVKKVALRILVSSLTEANKNSVLKGIERFCKWAVRTEMWEDNPKVWEDLAELLAIMLFPPKTDDSEEEVQTAVKSVSLEDFSPIFIAASEDNRPAKLYSLLIFIIKRLADKIVGKESKDNKEVLAGLVRSFEELTCRKAMDKTKLENALKTCKPDVSGYNDLHALLHPN